MTSVMFWLHMQAVTLVSATSQITRLDCAPRPKTLPIKASNKPVVYSKGSIVSWIPEWKESYIQEGP